MTTIIQTVIELLIIGFLIILSVYDIKYRKVKNKAVFLFLLPAAAKCIFGICVGSPVDVIPMLLGSAAGFFILLSAAMITRGGIGGGDIKLMAVLGLSAGLKGILISLCTASLLCLICGMIYTAVKKTALRTLPFVPFITAGYLILLLTKIF